MFLKECFVGLPPTKRCKNQVGPYIYTVNCTDKQYPCKTPEVFHKALYAVFSMPAAFA